MYNVIALIGPSGCGKDYIAKNLCTDTRFNRVVSDTTRPQREGEEDGKDYHFTGIGEFAKNVVDGNMLDAVNYKGWYYGTNISSLDKDKFNILVTDPERLRILHECKDIFLVVIHITADDKQRLIKTLEREIYPDCKEVCRRFLADEKMFNDIEDIKNYDEFFTAVNDYTYSFVEELRRVIEDEFIETY